MTISSDDRRREYPGNGVTTTFNGPRVFSASDLAVYLVDDVTHVPTLVSTGDYTLTGVGRASSRIVMAVAPPTGKTLLALRTVAYDQPTDITNQGAFLPEIHENAFDRQVMQVQQLADSASRSLRVPDTSVGIDPIQLDLPGRFVITTPNGFGVSDTPPLGDLTLRTDLSDPLGGASLVTYKATGTGAISRSLLSKLQEFPSLLDYIPVAEHAAIKAGTSSYDCTAAIQAAVDENTHIYVPAGIYPMTGIVSVPYGTSIHGAGWQESRFARAGADFSFFNLDSHCSLEGVGFERIGATAHTSGRVIDCGINTQLRDVFIDHCWDGIYLTGCNGVFMERIYVNNWLNAGVNVDGACNDIQLSNFIMSHVATPVGTGIRLHNHVEAFSCINGDIIGGEYGLTTSSDDTPFAPENRLCPQFNKFTKVFFDSSELGVYLDFTNATTFTNCWFATSLAGSGVNVDEAYYQLFDGCTFITNYAHGIALINPAQQGVRLANCQLLNNNLGNIGAHGIVATAGVSDWSVTDCDISNNAFPASPGQSYGIFIDTGSSDRYIVRGNNLTGNALGGMQDLGTGTNKRIGGNVGYDPPYTAPTFLNGWANLGSTHQPAGYRKDEDGVVHIVGTVQSGTAPGVIFNLPAGFRPANLMIFTVISNGAIGRVDININGDVELVAGNNTYVALQGISFRAA